MWLLVYLARLILFCILNFVHIILEIIIKFYLLQTIFTGFIWSDPNLSKFKVLNLEKNNPLVNWTGPIRPNGQTDSIQPDQVTSPIRPDPTTSLSIALSLSLSLNRSLSLLYPLVVTHATGRRRCDPGHRRPSPTPPHTRKASPPSPLLNPS
jgi:hypothetical protein